MLRKNRIHLYIYPITLLLACVMCTPSFSQDTDSESTNESIIGTDLPEQGFSIARLGGESELVLNILKAVLVNPEKPNKKVALRSKVPSGVVEFTNNYRTIEGQNVGAYLGFRMRMAMISVDSLARTQARMRAAEESGHKFRLDARTTYPIANANASYVLSVDDKEAALKGRILRGEEVPVSLALIRIDADGNQLFGVRTLKDENGDSIPAKAIAQITKIRRTAKGKILLSGRIKLKFEEGVEVFVNDQEALSNVLQARGVTRGRTVQGQNLIISQEEINSVIGQIFIIIARFFGCELSEEDAEDINAEQRLDNCIENGNTLIVGENPGEISCVISDENQDVSLTRKKAISNSP